MLRILAVVLGGALLVPAVFADEQADKVERAMKKLHELVRHAEELQESGRHAEAEKARAEAHALKAELEAYVARQRKEKASEGGGEREAQRRELIQTLEGLEQGMVALKRLGRTDEMEQLGRVADDVRRKIKHLDGEGRDKKPDDERVQLGNRIELTIVALKALADGGRSREADILERVVRAMRMDFEGRRDEEANQFRKQAPGPEDRAELLRLAAEILADQGKRDRADLVAKLARELQGKARPQERRYEVEVRHEGEQRRVVELERREGPPGQPPRAGPREGPDMRAVMERLERLEQRVERLMNALKEKQSRARHDEGRAGDRDDDDDGEHGDDEDDDDEHEDDDED